ncbi:CcmD family protein [bacterium SCSIO 12741]|nr:CcmD family protein [bacterium SCSIO 12741]
MNKINISRGLKTFLAVVLLWIGSIQAALANPKVEMADTFRAEGKIYVVVAVMSIVFLGVAIYLFYLDRKVKKLEKHLDS